MRPDHYSQAAEFEQALFGAAILAPSMLDELAELVSQADFHDRDLGRAFALMADMNAARLPVSDVRLLADKLNAAGLLDAIGGVAFVAKATSDSYAHNAVWYAHRVRELAQLRKLTRLGERLVLGADKAGAEPAALRETVAAELDAIQQHDTSRDVQSLGTMVGDALEKIRDARRRGVTLGLSTRLAELDDATGGFFPGSLTILAARPSVGKSAFAVELAARLAEQDKRVLIISLEMSGQDLAHRFLCRETGIPVLDLKTGELSDYQESQLVEVTQRLRTMPLKCFAASSATVAAIRARAKVQMAQDGLDLLVIDYLGLIGGNSRLSTYERTTAISRELKQLAMHIDRPVLCLAQLNREAAKGGKPSLAHLRDSGAIEQDADNVWLLHRDDLSSSHASLIIAKQRQGCVGTIGLTFNGDRMSFHAAELCEEWTG